jgi:outer membrane receptor for Fe3+-dicitrate
MKLLDYFFSHFTSPGRIAAVMILASFVFSSEVLVNGADSKAQSALLKPKKEKAAAKATAEASEKNATKQSSATNKVVVTGSHIPRKIKHYGNLSETSSPVYVVDRKEIERSGASTITELLTKLPYAR